MFKSDRQRRGFFAGLHKSKSSQERMRDALKHKNILGEGAKKRKKLTADEKFNVVMKEYARGTLHSGSGEIVTDKQQALAIAYSEARQVDSSYGNHSLRGSKYGEKEKTNKEEIRKSELKKGIAVEREHADTIRAIKREKLSTRKAEERIAKDHIKENPHYYEKLKKLRL